MKTRSVKCAAVLTAVVVVQIGLDDPAWAAKGAAATSPDSGRIAFVSTRDGNAEIYGGST